MFKICDESSDESGSPHAGAALRNVINRDCFKTGLFKGDVELLRGGVLTMCDCKIYVQLTWIAKFGGGFKICDQPGSPKEGACLRYVRNRDSKGGGMFRTCEVVRAGRRTKEGRVEDLSSTGIAG